MWQDDRRRAVLLHELPHVGRRDCLTQTLATIACALYWAHPGVWWVARRLRIGRELGCDDRVLTLGAQPRDYAGHLLELAYAFGGGLYRRYLLRITAERRPAPRVARPRRRARRSAGAGAHLDRPHSAQLTFKSDAARQ